MRIKGIDLSGYNTVVNYDDVAKDDVDFVILKIIRKDLQPDKLFETHWKNFEDRNIPIQGVYNYSYATTVAKFKSDAEVVVKILNGRKVMVWLDVEDASLKNLGKTLIDGIIAYGNVIRAAGLEFGIYTYESFYNSCLKTYEDMLQYPFWIAKYPSSKQVDNSVNVDLRKCPDIHKTLYGWQYSSAGKVNGINGNVDLNEWFVDIEASYAKEVTVYVPNGFREELAMQLGLPATINARDVLAKTKTISSNKNRYDASITALERLLKSYGYYTGSIEADNGKKPCFGNGMAKATYLYQAKIVGLKKPDKEWTAGKNSYKKALGL